MPSLAWAWMRWLPLPATWPLRSARTSLARVRAPLRAAHIERLSGVTSCGVRSTHTHTQRGHEENDRFRSSFGFSPRRQAPGQRRHQGFRHPSDRVRSRLLECPELPLRSHVTYLGVVTLGRRPRTQSEELCDEVGLGPSGVSLSKPPLGGRRSTGASTTDADGLLLRAASPSESAAKVQADVVTKVFAGLLCANGDVF